MTMRTRFAGGCSLCRLAVLALVAIAAVLISRPALSQQPTPAEAGVIENAKLTLDRVEAGLGRDDISVDELGSSRSAVTAARDALGGTLEKLEPRLAEAQARLKEIGPAPGKDAPAEAPALTAERERLSQTLAALDGAVKQIRLLMVRSDQLLDRITSRRHALYAGQILERSPSALDPAFWAETVRALPEEFVKVENIAELWADAVARAGWVRVAAAAICMGATFAAAFWLRRRLRHRYANGAATSGRFGKACSAVWGLLSVTALAPLVAWTVLALLRFFQLWTSPLDRPATGLVIGILAVSLGRGAAQALFAPGRPERRLVSLSEEAAACLAEHLVWSTRVLGLAIVLQVTHRSLVVPLSLAIATNVLFASAIALLLIRLALGLQRIEADAPRETGPAVPWVRPLAWAIAAALAIALVAGYAGLAAFLAFRTLVAAVLVCGLYPLLVAVDSLFTEALAPETPRGRAVAAHLGVAPRTAGLVGTLLSAAIRLCLLLLAFTLVVGPWEASTVDLLESIRSVPLGFRIGEISISMRGVLSALAVLLLVLAGTRVAQRWLQARFLPMTGLEPSLQLSIATIFGYLGVITGIALALGALGIDLQKIAIVAGALSVGIGFGLQSIVSNFVSGLILLAERPIRVGDSIVVKGEEGWVRRIRVRATEIETFERASVIIPNSELITGLVKNWTHANTLGRIIVKLAVSYDSDPEQVRELLEKVAGEHPQVVKSPAPRAFLLGFGDHALQFELRCVVANVDQGLSVRSDLHIAILKRLREAGIDIPVPPLAAQPRGAPTPPAPPTAAGTT
ncbi:MAG TPA: DUF3772 domain-containing protein [Xanthobacteraceae bacterium]|nr:DUF3772 domain-containing protein [Xanthobacteraceae bacterium]